MTLSKLGENVSEYKVGDRVAGETHIPCNNCFQCKTNNRHICENMKIIGVQVPGSFCEYISIPKDCVYKVSDKVSYEMGAMLEPMGVGVHGRFRCKGERPERFDLWLRTHRSDGDRRRENVGGKKDFCRRCV